MITAEQITPYRTANSDFAETMMLKEKFAELRVARRPFMLTKREFDEIIKWKLRGQYVRQRGLREANTEGLIRAVTAFALTLKHADWDYELELRLGILSTLRGVGVPVASAVLGLVFPETYAVIDGRGWRQVFGEEQATFSISDYKRYLLEVQRLAQELDWQVQEVDLALWEYDRQVSAGIETEADPASVAPGNEATDEL